MSGKTELDLAIVILNKGATAVDIADALDKLRFGWPTIAEALWNSGAMAGKKALDLAKVMVNEGATAVDIADAFDERLGRRKHICRWSHRSRSIRVVSSLPSLRGHVCQVSDIIGLRTVHISKAAGLCRRVFSAFASL